MILVAGSDVCVNAADSRPPLSSLAKQGVFIFLVSSFQVWIIYPSGVFFFGCLFLKNKGNVCQHSDNAEEVSNEHQPDSRMLFLNHTGALWIKTSQMGGKHCASETCQSCARIICIAALRSDSHGENKYTWKKEIHLKKKSHKANIFWKKNQPRTLKERTLWIESVKFMATCVARLLLSAIQLGEMVFGDWVVLCATQSPFFSFKIILWTRCHPWGLAMQENIRNYRAGMTFTLLRSCSITDARLRAGAQIYRIHKPGDLKCSLSAKMTRGGGSSRGYQSHKSAFKLPSKSNSSRGFLTANHCL